MFDSILVVCVGNICRSPIGERLLRKMLPGRKVDSAGLAALVGNPADAKAILAADKHGISLEGHQAQQLTARMCREYELILVMEKEHIKGVCRFAPEVRGKTMLFAHWVNQCDVTDPYGKSYEAFNLVYQLLSEATEKWAQALNR